MTCSNSMNISLQLYMFTAIVFTAIHVCSYTCLQLYMFTAIRVYSYRVYSYTCLLLSVKNIFEDCTRCSCWGVSSWARRRLRLFSGWGKSKECVSLWGSWTNQYVRVLGPCCYGGTGRHSNMPGSSERVERCFVCLFLFLLDIFDHFLSGQSDCGRWRRWLTLQKLHKHLRKGLKIEINKHIKLSYVSLYLKLSQY